MDWSPFWMALIFESLIYGTMWGMSNDSNVKASRAVFLAISLPVSTLLLYLFFNFEETNLPLPPFPVHAIAVISPVLIFFLLFNQTYKRSLQTLKQKDEEKARFEALSPDEKIAELNAEKSKQEKRAKERQTATQVMLYGPIVPALVCPHCLTKGSVRRTQAHSKEVVLTTSHTYKAKAPQTKMHCETCGTEWLV